MKRFFKALMLPLLMSMALAGCNKSTIKKVDSDTLYVKKVDNLSKDFIMGMDASSVIAEEQSGVKYYDFDGNETDVFKILADNGINYIRVRIWNDPYDKDGHGYGGGNNDVAKAIEIGKRAKKYGMKLLVNFHYSDFWADPSKQMIPKAWKGMDFFEKCEALYTFTKETLEAMKKENIDVGMVQVGNETSGGKMSGETRFDFFVSLFNYGTKAVKEVYPKALRAVHFANPEKNKNYLDWAAKMDQYGADYDVFGSSYYPYWHGTLENLSETLSTIAETYHKKTMILETSYCFNGENTDFWSNTIGDTSGYDAKPYPFTIAGQTNHVRDLIDTIANKTKNGIGVCYWEGTWIPVGTTSFEENSKKWEEFGSGWASSYAAEYDPKDAGQWYGGCAVENQAFFDATGHPLESLKVWNLVRFGNEAPLYADGVDDAYVTHYTDDTFTLPETVNAVYNDNSRQAIPVTWESFDIEAAKAAGNGKYDIKGVAQGNIEVYCHLTIMEFNFVANYSFEDGTEPWVVTNNSSAFDPNSYKALVGNENVQTGSKAFNFWASGANVCNFDVEQELTSIKTNGTYKYQVSLTGGTSGKADASKQNIYIYVKINDVITYQKEGKVTEWNQWHDVLLTDISINASDKIVIGVHIESSEAGIWGSIEDCMFNFVQ